MRCLPDIPAGIADARGGSSTARPPPFTLDTGRRAARGVPVGRNERLTGVLVATMRDPSKVRTPAPGFATDSNAKLKPASVDGQPAASIPFAHHPRHAHQRDPPPAPPGRQRTLPPTQLHPPGNFALARRPHRGHTASRLCSARTRLRRAVDPWPNADPAGLTARARPEARPEARAANLHKPHLPGGRGGAARSRERHLTPLRFEVVRVGIVRTLSSWYVWGCELAPNVSSGGGIRAADRVVRRRGYQHDHAAERGDYLPAIGNHAAADD